MHSRYLIKSYVGYVVSLDIRPDKVVIVNRLRSDLKRARTLLVRVFCIHFELIRAW